MHKDPRNSPCPESAVSHGQPPHLPPPSTFMSPQGVSTAPHTHPAPPQVVTTAPTYTQHYPEGSLQLHTHPAPPQGLYSSAHPTPAVREAASRLPLPDLTVTHRQPQRQPHSSLCPQPCQAEGAAHLPAASALTPLTEAAPQPRGTRVLPPLRDSLPASRRWAPEAPAPRRPEESPAAPVRGQPQHPLPGGGQQRCGDTRPPAGGAAEPPVGSRGEHRDALSSRTAPPAADRRLCACATALFA